MGERNYPEPPLKSTGGRPQVALTLWRQGVARWLPETEVAQKARGITWTTCSFSVGSERRGPVAPRSLAQWATASTFSPAPWVHTTR